MAKRDTAILLKEILIAADEPRHRPLISSVRSELGDR
jgi:hypothetical protein